MGRSKHLTREDAIEFAEVVQKWSERADSFYLRQFWQTVGLSEMQFYRRAWKAQKEVDSFNLEEIKKILRQNRDLRDDGGQDGQEEDGKDRKKRKGSGKESCVYAEEGGRI